MQSQFIPLFHGLRNHRNVVPTFRERTKRIAAFCRALSWPKTNLGYKIRVLDLSESLAYICTYETLFPYGWKPYKYGRKWRIDSCGIHQDKKTAERTTIFCSVVVVSGTQRGEKLTTSSERVDRDRATEEIWHRLKGTLETNTASTFEGNKGRKNMNWRDAMVT